MAICFRGVVVAAALLGATSATAETITGITYTYDLSTPDVDPGGNETFVTVHVDADDTDDETDLTAITSIGLLTDGDLGSTEVTDPDLGCCLFNNGTYAGFRNDLGVGNAPQPKIDLNLGGSYELNFLTVHYLVEDQPSIYAPQPIPDGMGGNLFDALTVYGSTDGMLFDPLGFSNDFNPIYGLDGDFGSGAQEVRTATIDLAGSTASHVSVDIRTPYAFIFLSEVIVDGTAIGGISGDFNGDGAYDCLDINALTTEIALGTNDAAFDLTRDGAVNLDDRDAWLAEAGKVNLMSGNPHLLGDANLDGVVDVSDFNLWNGSKFTDNSLWCSGDFNADGSVDVSDFNLWNGNKFLSADSGRPAAVPEPAACGFLSLVAALILVTRPNARGEARHRSS